MVPNFLFLALAALIPLVIGFVWYNPKVFGTAWMSASGMTEDKMKGANMPVIFGLTYVLSFIAALALFGLVIHQASTSSLFVTQPGFDDPNSEVRLFWDNFMQQYGTLHRSFGHGALHGAFGAILFGLPILGINALFERKGFKYIAINVGYWIVSFALMGGIICQYA